MRMLLRLNASRLHDITGRWCLPPVPVSGTTFRVRYEWDEGKAAENIRKHGVDFMDAIAALEDPNRVEEIPVPL